MTRKRSSPMGLEIHLSVLLAFLMLPLLAQAAPLQDYTEIQQYTDGCYYNYNHYNEGDRIMTNEPCLNCTCHNKMLMCYLRVCPFTKPIGHDCIVEKREDQCCPIITCPEVPVDVSHAVPEVGTELSFPEKFGCSINGKFYLEGAQVPSNPNKPCELCYCIKNRTSCLMQECTLHIDGCTPIYNKGSCCPVRYNCDHENDVLELEDHSSTTEATTTTTTERPTTGFIITSTANPRVSNNCIHSGERYADGARIPGETACENCYCMRGEIVCAVQECHMPMLNDNGKLCHPLPAAEGECCPSNYICEDNTAPTHIFEATTLPYSLDENIKTTTYAPVKDLHGAIPEEDLQLQTHIDEEETVTKMASVEGETQENLTEPTTTSTTSSIENQTKHKVVDQEPVTNYLENVEMTTISSSDFKPVKNEEFITTAPASSDTLHESSTDLIADVKNESITMATTRPHDKYPTEDEKETDIGLTTDAYELPGISTHSTESSKEIVTITPAKSELEEPTTEIISNQEHVFSETTQSTNEVKPIIVGEQFTQVPITDIETITSRGEEIAIESITKSTSDEENATPTTAEVPSQTIAHLAEEQQNELVTESSINLPSKESEIEREKYDELYTKATTPEKEEKSVTAEGENAITEETGTITTKTPGKLTVGKEDFSTIEPEVERKPLDVGKEQQETITTFITPLDKHEISTEYGNKPEAQYSTTISAETDEIEEVTTVSTSEEELSPNTAPDTLKDDKESSIENLPTKPIRREHEGSADIKPISDDITNGTLSEAGKDHFVTEIKPMIEDDLGSGDFADSVTPELDLELWTIRPTFEVETSIPPEFEQENTAPTKGQDISTEFSNESDEDNKLMNLTTAIVSAAENLKGEKDQLESSTIKALFTDVPTSTDVTKEISEEGQETYSKTSSEAEFVVSTSSPFKTQDQTKADEEVALEDKTLFTTISTPLEEKLPTQGQIHGEEHKDKFFGTTEVSGITKIAEEFEEKESSEEQDTKSDIPQKSVESTTNEGIEEHIQETLADTKADIVTEGEDLPMLPNISIHKDEEEFGITDSPMLTFENIPTFTTQQPTAQIDITTQPGAEAEEAKEDESIEIQKEVHTTTLRAPSDSAHVEQIPDLQLPSVIPGEGNCLVGKKTYEHNSVVPTSDECELICRCANSIVVCEPFKCDVPENLEKCILDKTTSNKCCPSYTCEAEENTKSTEEESEENIPYTTASNNIIMEKVTDDLDTYQHTITKPISSTFDPGMSIPEIEMPVVITEEPMSHIKDDNELEQETTKSPNTTTPVDKKDLIIEELLSSTPSPIVEDKISGQEIEMKKVPDENAGKVIVAEQPVKEYKEQISSAIADRGTDSAPHIPRDEKEDTEIYVTTVASTAATEQHITKEEYTGEKTTLSTLMSSSIPVEEATTEKIFEKLEPIPTLLSSEEPNELETQTNKSISDESIDHSTKPHGPETQTLETHTIRAGINDEQNTLPPSTDKDTAEISQTTPSKDAELPKLSTKLDENLYLTEKNNTNIFESTTISVAREDHTSENSSEDITFTTVMPTAVDFKEHIFPISSESSNETKDHSIVQKTSDELLESTIASVMGGGNEYPLVTSKNDDKGITTPTPSQFEKEIEHSTGVSQIDDETSVEYVTSAEDEITISPITQYEHKKTTGLIQSFTSEMPIEELSADKQPETQTNTAIIEDHKFTQSTGRTEEEIQTTSVPQLNQMVSDNTSPNNTEVSDIETESPINFETKPVTSSSTISIAGMQTETFSTTVAYTDQISNESTPSVEDHTVLSFTDNSVEQQTGSTKKVEADEKTESIDVSTRKDGESIKEEITTISSIEQVKGEVDQTLSTSIENVESITKSPTMKVEYAPEDGTGHSTSSPTTSDESEVASSEEEVIPAKEINIVATSEADTLYFSTTLAPRIEIENKNTHNQVNQPALDLSEETSGESLESEEEISNEPSTTQHIEEFVTQHRAEVDSTSTIMPFNEVTENEASGEGDEEIYKTKATTSEPQLPAVEQQKEMYAPTEHTDASDEQMFIKVSTNKIPEELIHSPVTKAPIVNNESVTNAPDITNDDSATKTENDIFSSTTKSTAIEESPEHIKEQILEKDVVASVTEGPIQIEVNENVTTQQPESEETTTSQHIATENFNQTKVYDAQVTTETEEISSDEPETANSLEVTKAPWATSYQHERKNATTSGTSMATDDVTDKHLKDEVTEAPTSADEIKPESDRTEPEEDISEPPKEYIEFSTKYPSDYVDINMATVEPIASEANIPTDMTKIPNISQISGSTDSSDPKIVDIATTLQPISEVSEVTPSPDSSNEIEHPTEQTTKELPNADIHALSTTSIPSEDVDMVTIKLSAEREEPLDTTVAPETLEIDVTTVRMSDQGSETADISIKEVPITEIKNEIDNMIQVTTSLPHEVSDTKSPNMEANLDEESHEMITEIPLSAEVITVKLPDIMDLATEYPTEGNHSERDQFHESTTKTPKGEEVPTDKLSEPVTEFPTKYTKSTEKSHLETTELSIHTHLSTENSSELQENEPELSTKDVEQEEVSTPKKSTELPTSSHTSFDELPERSTMLPNKDKESEKEPDLPVINEVSTVKFTTQDMELPTKDKPIKNKQPTELSPHDDFSIGNFSGQTEGELSTKSTESAGDSHEEFTELSLDVHITTEQVPGHVTELSTQSHKDHTETESVTEQLDSHKHSTHSADILPDRSTESQQLDIHTEHDGYEEKTELTITAISTEKTPELTTKYPESAEESHEKATVPHEISASGPAVEQTTESAFKIGEHDKETSAEAIEDSSAVKLYPVTTGHPLFPYYTTLPSVDFNSRIDDTSRNNTSVIENDEDSFTKPSTTIVSTTTSEPIAPSAPHYQPQPPIYGPPPQYGPTQYEDEYTDEDEGEVFGPGTCRYGGKLYVSAQQIPRDDPCDFCFCFRSDIICLQQSCPPPIAGCHEEPISGFCCPRYECPVSMATVLNITTSTTTTSTTLPPHFLHHNYGNNLQRNGCLINGRSYRVGEKIESTSGPCINCTCGGDGKMKCDPQACVPEPTMQQVMAVVAAGRKR